MRNPNGYGSIYQNKSGRRRKKWVARITTGWEIGEDGKAIQQRKVIGYYETKKEAQQALFDYNDNKYNINYLNYTFTDIYNKMISNRKDISKSTLNAYKMSFNILSELHNYKFSEIKTQDYQQIINTCDKEYHTLRKIKQLLSQMYQYCLKNDLCNKDISKLIDIGKSETKEKEIFSDEEIGVLFENDDKDICKILLILIYTSCRISELLDLKRKDVYIEERYLDIKESKTENGIRKIPIAKKILPYIEYFYNKENEYLITNRLNKQFKYSNFKREYFDRLIKELNFNSNLSIHSTRHTTISLLVKKEVPSTFIKLICGHSGAKELFEKTYTHINIEELIKYIDMI